MTTRAKAGIQKPNPRYVLLAPRYALGEPKNITEALKHSGWTLSAEEEIETCHMLHTWELVPETEDMNVLGYRWVFKIKLNPDGTVKKLRSRLVAKGFNQEEGLDYFGNLQSSSQNYYNQIVL